MASNSRRQHELSILYSMLGKEINERGLVDKATKTAEQLRSHPEKLDRVTDAEWALMLPPERNKHLIGYFLTKRALLLAIQEEEQEAKKRGRWLQWRHSPAVAVKAIELTAALATLADLAAQHGPTIFRAFGLGAGGSHATERSDVEQEISPTDAVVDSEGRIKEELRRCLAVVRAFESNAAYTAADSSTLARMGAERGVLSQKAIQTFTDLIALRERAEAGERLPLSSEETMQVLAQADAVLNECISFDESHSRR